MTAPLRALRRGVRNHHDHVLNNASCVAVMEQMKENSVYRNFIFELRMLDIFLFQSH